MTDVPYSGPRKIMAQNCAVADAEAYAVAVPNSATLGNVAESYGYSDTGWSSLTSSSNLIKDELNVFYSVTTAYYSGAWHIWVWKYDAESDTQNYYTITVPAEYSRFYTYPAVKHQWYVYKSSDTELALVVYGAVAGGSNHDQFEFQHYTWTIGTTTFTYVNRETFDTPYWTNDGYPFVAMFGHHAYYVRLEANGTQRIVRMMRYDLLDADGGEDGNLFTVDTAGTGINHFDQDWYWNTFTSAEQIYFVFLYDENTSTKNCTCYLWPESTHSNGARLMMQVDSYDLDGFGSSYTEEIDSIGGGMGANFKNLCIWPEWSSDIENTVYFRISYETTGNGPVDCVFCLYGNINPGDQIWNWRYVTIHQGETGTEIIFPQSWSYSEPYGTNWSTTVLSIPGTEGDYTTPIYWQPAWSPYPYLNSYYDGRVFPGRNAKCLSLVSTPEDGDVIMNWASLSTSEVLDTDIAFWGTGQLPDDNPVICARSSAAGTDYMVGEDGGHYSYDLGQYYGTGTFVCGRWVVKGFGEYRIFGPILFVEDCRPRWQVV